MKTAARLAGFVLVLPLVGIVSGGCKDKSKSQDPNVYGVEEQRQTDKREIGTTTLSGAPWVANESAIDRIVGARCSRETMCANVGPDKHFVSTEGCLRELRASTQNDLQTAECPGGIDAKQLEECLSAINRESCSNPIDAISRVANCQKVQLCLSGETRRQP